MTDATEPMPGKRPDRSPSTLPVKDKTTAASLTPEFLKGARWLIDTNRDGGVRETVILGASRAVLDRRLQDVRDRVFQLDPKQVDYLSAARLADLRFAGIEIPENLRQAGIKALEKLIDIDRGGSDEARIGAEITMLGGKCEFSDEYVIRMRERINGIKEWWEADRLAELAANMRLAGVDPQLSPEAWKIMRGAQLQYARDIVDITKDEDTSGQLEVGGVGAPKYSIPSGVKLTANLLILEADSIEFTPEGVKFTWPENARVKLPETTRPLAHAVTGRSRIPWNNTH